VVGMNFHEEEKRLPTEGAKAKKANSAKDDKIRSYWDRLVDEWSKVSAKSPSKDDKKAN
jgi:hypothetical protein